jgi:hypothetical protein
MNQRRLKCLVAVVAVFSLIGRLGAQEPDASPSVKSAKVLLIASTPDHPWASHMYEHECQLLAACLEKAPGVRTAVSVGWPRDAKTLDGVTAMVFYCKHAGDVLLNPTNRDDAVRLLKNGAGLTAIHWSTGADVQYGPQYMELLGGWFNRAHSGLNTTKAWLDRPDGDHPIYRGWRPWEIRDEFYLDLKFHEKTRPLLTVTLDGKKQVVGWTIERPDSNGGRSFGTTLGHFHDNFERDDFRRRLVNGILWTAHVEIPREGAAIDVDEKYIRLPPKPE